MYVCYGYKRLKTVSKVEKNLETVASAWFGAASLSLKGQAFVLHKSSFHPSKVKLCPS